MVVVSGSRLCVVTDVLVGVSEFAQQMDLFCRISFGGFDVCLDSMEDHVLESLVWRNSLAGDVISVGRIEVE